MEKEKRHRALAVICMVAILAGSCVRIEENADREYSNTPRGNFVALWNIMDKHYCFFDLKKEELGVDWDEVYKKYSPSVSEGMSDRALFEVLCSMIGELRDGHVNLNSPYDYGRNWHWKTDYPSNFSKDLRDAYLGDDYIIAGSGYYYRILPDNIGYFVVESFEDEVSETRINVMLNNMALCNGLIIDIRDNGGGLLTAAQELASRFTEERVLTGYSCYKKGPGHNDFSALEENWLEPDEYNLRWIKPVVLIVNRGCFSSANDFANSMKALRNVTLLGDSTGGGGGLPMSSELPNGWSVRYSSAPSFDASKNHIESGVAPDTVVSMSHSDMQKGYDTLIEAARDLINSKILNP